MSVNNSIYKAAELDSTQLAMELYRRRQKAIVSVRNSNDSWGTIVATMYIGIARVFVFPHIYNFKSIA